MLDFVALMSGVSISPTITAGQIGTVVTYVILFIVWLVKGQTRAEMDSKTLKDHEEMLKTHAATQNAQAILQIRQQTILEQLAERLDKVETALYK